MPPLSRHDGPYAGDRIDWPRILSHHAIQQRKMAPPRQDTGKFAN
jgi:hypothetical protein